MTMSKFTIELDDEDSDVLVAVDTDGNVIASARHDDSRWAITADDGLELPDAYVGDEAAARCWLGFIAHLWTGDELEPTAAELAQRWDDAVRAAAVSGEAKKGGHW